MEAYNSNGIGLLGTVLNPARLYHFCKTHTPLLQNKEQKTNWMQLSDGCCFFTLFKFSFPQDMSPWTVNHNATGMNVCKLFEVHGGGFLTLSKYMYVCFPVSNKLTFKICLFFLMCLCTLLDNHTWMFPASQLKTFMTGSNQPPKHATPNGTKHAY